MAKKIYVGNLSFSTTENDVNELFSEFGEVQSVQYITDRETGRFRGFCFVEMDDAGAEEAIEALDGREVDGRNLKVNEARPKEDRGGGNRGGGNRGGGGYRGGGGGNRDGGNRDGGNRGGGSRW